MSSFFKSFINSATSSASASPSNAATANKPTVAVPSASGHSPTSSLTSPVHGIHSPSGTSTKKPAMRVLIRGDRETGKSCLLKRLQGSAFIDQHCVTPHLTSTIIQWQYKTSDDTVSVEVWDVVDRAIIATHTPPSSALPIPYDAATAADLYHSCSAIFAIIDPSRPTTLDYVKKLMPSIPLHVDVLLILNFRDYPDAQRLVTDSDIQQWLRTVTRTSIRTIEVSLKNGFGLKHLHNFLNVPFLNLRVRALELELERVRSDVVAAEKEVELMAEDDYGRYCQRLAMQVAKVEDTLTPEQRKREQEKRLQQERVNHLLQQEAEKQKQRKGEEANKKISSDASIEKAKEKHSAMMSAAMPGSKPAVIIDKAAEKAALATESVDDFVPGGDDDSFFGDEETTVSEMLKQQVEAKKPRTAISASTAAGNDDDDEYVSEDELDDSRANDLNHEAPDTMGSNPTEFLDEPDFDDAAPMSSPFGAGPAPTVKKSMVGETRPQSSPASQMQTKEMPKAPKPATPIAQPIATPTVALSAVRKSEPEPDLEPRVRDADGDSVSDDDEANTFKRPVKQYSFDLDASEPFFDDDDVEPAPAPAPAKATVAADDDDDDLAHLSKKIVYFADEDEDELDMDFSAHSNGTALASSAVAAAVATIGSDDTNGANSAVVDDEYPIDMNPITTTDSLIILPAHTDAPAQPDADLDIFNDTAAEATESSASLEQSDMVDMSSDTNPAEPTPSLQDYYGTAPPSQPRSTDSNDLSAIAAIPTGSALPAIVDEVTSDEEDRARLRKTKNVATSRDISDDDDQLELDMPATIATTTTTDKRSRDESPVKQSKKDKEKEKSKRKKETEKKRRKKSADSDQSASASDGDSGSDSGSEEVRRTKKKKDKSRVRSSDKVKLTAEPVDAQWLDMFAKRDDDDAGDKKKKKKKKQDREKDKKKKSSKRKSDSESDSASQPSGSDDDDRRKKSKHHDRDRDGRRSKDSERDRKSKKKKSSRRHSASSASDDDSDRELRAKSKSKDVDDFYAQDAGYKPRRAAAAGRSAPSAAAPAPPPQPQPQPQARAPTKPSGGGFLSKLGLK